MTKSRKLTTLPTEFLEAVPVMDVLHQHGYEAYFVGGSVRDVLLGKKIHDVDIATSAYPEEVKQLFHRTVDVGIEHGTVLVLLNQGEYEVTTFRTESTYQDFRRPDQVTFVRSLKEDLKRRDFTMNALAMDTTGNIVDLFEGMKDLDNRCIKAVGNPSERFHEDALRMMRGLRFASQLDFEIESATYEAICEHHALLDKISVERIQVEFEKLLMGGNRKKGLDPLISTGCYKYCPELADKKENLVHLANLSNQPFESVELAWLVTLAALDIQPAQVKAFLRQWKCSNELARLMTQSVKALQQRLLTGWTLDLLYQSGEKVITLVETACPYFGQPSQLSQSLSSYQQLPIHSMKDLAVTGQDLLGYFKQPPGKWLGDMLNYFEEEVLFGRIENDREKLLQAADLYQKGDN